MLHIVPVPAPGCAPLNLALAQARPSRRIETREFLSPRTVIFHEGFATAPQYRLVEGCVALSQTLSDGRRQIIDIVGPGRLIGLAFGDRNNTTAETLSYCHVEPARELGFADMRQALGEMVARIEAHALLLGRKTAPEKVASAILDLAEQFVRPQRNKRDGRVFNLHPSRADLADWLGLTVETVSRCFNRFKKAGLIAFSDPEIVTLLQPALLREIAAGNRVPDAIPTF